MGLYVGYYASQRQGQTMHSPMNCMPGSGWEPLRRDRVKVEVQGSQEPGPRFAEINYVVVQKGLDRMLVFYWYQAHGRVIASEYLGQDLHGGRRHPPQQERRVDGQDHRAGRLPKVERR